MENTTDIAPCRSYEPGEDADFANDPVPRVMEEQNRVWAAPLARPGEPDLSRIRTAISAFVAEFVAGLGVKYQRPMASRKRQLKDAGP